MNEPSESADSQLSPEDGKEIRMLFHDARMLVTAVESRITAARRICSGIDFVDPTTLGKLKEWVMLSRQMSYVVDRAKTSITTILDAAGIEADFDNPANLHSQRVQINKDKHAAFDELNRLTSTIASWCDVDFPKPSV